jgi:hypothetical protein
MPFRSTGCGPASGCFQAWADDAGNVYCLAGTLLQARTGVSIPVGGGADLGMGDGSPVLGPSNGWALRPFPSVSGAACLGGSGRNLILSGLATDPSRPEPPGGTFIAGEPDAWRSGIFTLTKTGASAATIHDGTDTVAVLSTGGTAPVGSYAGTAYGKTTYSGGADFTLTATAETGTPLAVPGAVSQVSAGTAPAGAWTATDAAHYELDADTDWTLVVAADGSAEILYLTTAMAARADGPAWSPAGIYAATTAGKTAYNSGADWEAMVSLVPVDPREGFVYLEIVESSGTVTEVNGPSFGTLPSDTTDTYYFPLAYSSGTGGLEQLHTGTLVWPSAGGGGSTATDPTLRNMFLLGL